MTPKDKSLLLGLLGWLILKEIRGNSGIMEERAIVSYIESKSETIGSDVKDKLDAYRYFSLPYAEFAESAISEDGIKFVIKHLESNLYITKDRQPPTVKLTETGIQYVKLYKEMEALGIDELSEGMLAEIEEISERNEMYRYLIGTVAYMVLETLNDPGDYYTGTFFELKKAMLDNPNKALNIFQGRSNAHFRFAVATAFPNSDPRWAVCIQDSIKALLANKYIHPTETDVSRAKIFINDRGENLLQEETTEAINFLAESFEP